jgi:hypothetical protein
MVALLIVAGGYLGGRAVGHAVRAGPPAPGFDDAALDRGPRLNVFPGTTDPQIIDPYMNQLFDDIDEYHLMRRGCTNLRAQA